MMCKVCKYWFFPKREDIYVVQEYTGILTPPTLMDAVDCPKCGRQHLLGVRLPKVEGGNTDDH